MVILVRNEWISDKNRSPLMWVSALLKDILSWSKAKEADYVYPLFPWFLAYTALLSLWTFHLILNQTYIIAFLDWPTVDDSTKRFIFKRTRDKTNQTMFQASCFIRSLNAESQKCYKW